MQNQIHTPQTQARTSAPLRRRVSAAVIAQYIQDLTHPAPPAPCPA